MNKVNILITGAGGAAAIALQKTYAPRRDLQIFMADMDTLSSGLYLVPAKQRLQLPAGDSESYAEKLLALCVQHEIDLLIPTVDVELVPIASRQDAFESAGIKVLISPLSTLKVCYDKLRLMQFLDGEHPLAGYAVFDEHIDLPASVYPFILKPRVGSGARGIRLIQSPKDALGVPRDGSYLFQEYLPGAEYSVDVYVTANGNVVASVVRERLKIDSGIAVISRTIKNVELSAQAEKIARLIGIRYVANIQFRLDQHGQARLLEVNPRFPGTMPLTIAAGVDMPAMCLADAMHKPLPTHCTYEEIAMVRAWQEYFLPISELTGGHK